MLFQSCLLCLFSAQSKAEVGEGGQGGDQPVRYGAQTIPWFPEEGEVGGLLGGG
jgi:hypothetical protein